MQNKRFVLFCLVMLLAGGVVAWFFQPTEETAPSGNIPATSATQPNDFGGPPTAPVQPAPPANQGSPSAF